MPPDLIAPLVAFLAHEDCPVSGEIYAAAPAASRRLHWGDTGLSPPRPQPTMEDIVQNWAAINDEAGYYVPADLNAWSAAFLDHLFPTDLQPEKRPRGTAR